MAQTVEYVHITRWGGGLANAKDKEYELYRDYINRDWLILKKGDDKVQTIEKFLRQHEQCIIKPVHGTLGRGVIKVTKEDNIAEIILSLSDDDYILEECVVNREDIRQLNPSSLNTIRAFTHVDNEGKAILDEIILRVGMPGKVVDNWGAGGIIYYIDIESGIITKPGVDKRGKTYIFHPGCNEQMVGYKIAEFNVLKDYILAIANKNTDVKVVGWDIAITPKGIDLIELNCPGGHDILQVFGVPFWHIFKTINRK